MTYDVLLSYNSRDREAVERIGHDLRQEGLEVFLDRWYLPAGQRWQTLLEEHLGSCGAFAIFVGPHGLGSWQRREQQLAFDRQTREESFPIIPVVLPGAEPPLGFLSLSTWVDARSPPRGT